MEIPILDGSGSALFLVVVIHGRLVHGNSYWISEDLFVAYGYVFVLPKNIFLSIDEDFWLKRLHVFLVAFSVVELFSHILCSLPA